MDLALNNLQRLICHKTNNQTNQFLWVPFLTILWMVSNILQRDFPGFYRFGKISATESVFEKLSRSPVVLFPYFFLYSAIVLFCSLLIYARALTSLRYFLSHTWWFFPKCKNWMRQMILKESRKFTLKMIFTEKRQHCLTQDLKYNKAILSIKFEELAMISRIAC